MTRSRLLVPLAIAALLAACRNETPADQGGTASGEVLEGTISDAMLPLDTVRSQPPLAEPVSAGRTIAGGEGEASAGGEDAGEEAAAEGAAEEAPVAEDEEE